MSQRSIGREALQSIVSDVEKLNELEEHIFLLSNNDPKEYNTIVYDVTIDMKCGHHFDKVLQSVRQGKFGWNHEDFGEIIFKQREQDDFIINPFEVEEGVLTCPKCSKSRTFSYSKQTRSADEPMTTFATCMNCRHKWTYSG